MADDTKDKKVEAPKTLDEAVTLLTAQAESIGKLEAALKETTKESIERKEKIRAAEKEKAEVEQKRLAEEGKFKELVDQYKPKAERADVLEAAMKVYLDLEMADVPEEKRTLIPTGPVETQLKWLKEAKSQGIFGEPKKKPADSDQGKKGDSNNPDFLTWAPTDPRLQSLPIADYQRWKKHNGRDNTSAGGATPVGWGQVRK